MPRENDTSVAFTFVLNILYEGLAGLEETRGHHEAVSGKIALEALISAHKLLIMQYESIIEMVDEGSDA